MKQLALLGLMLTSSNCDRSGSREQPTLVRDTAAGGVVHLRLTRSLQELRDLATDTLQSDLVLGADTLSHFGSIGDVVTFADGRIEVLDLSSKSIFQFSQDGRPIGEIGGAGEAPGQFRRPVAIAVLGADIIVLQASEVRALTRLDEDGRPVASFSASGGGDWRAVVQRGPMLMQDGFGPTTSGAEDVTRRLSVLGDSTVVVLVQDAPTPERSAAHAVLLGLDAGLRKLDTLAELTPAAVRFVEPGSPHQGAPFYLALFDQRPVFAASQDWLAFGSSSDTVLQVTGRDGRLAVLVSWPATGQAVSAGHQLAAAAWTARRTVLLAPGAAQASEQLTEAEREAQVRRLAGLLPYATQAPELMAAFLAADCLWLAGFAPEDQTDGTALTLVGIDLKDGVYAGAVRVERPDGRVRHLDSRSVFVSWRDSLGSELVGRFPLGKVAAACGDSLPEP